MPIIIKSINKQNYPYKSNKKNKNNFIALQTGRIRGQAAGVGARAVADQGPARPAPPRGAGGLGEGTVVDR